MALCAVLWYNYHPMVRIREIYLRAALFAVATLSMAWGFRLLLFDHAPGVFSGVMEDLSYGWYVPLFSLYVLWRERRDIVASVGAEKGKKVKAVKGGSWASKRTSCRTEAREEGRAVSHRSKTGGFRMAREK